MPSLLFRVENRIPDVHLKNILKKDGVAQSLVTQLDSCREKYVRCICLEGVATDVATDVKRRVEESEAYVQLLVGYRHFTLYVEKKGEKEFKRWFLHGHVPKYSWPSPLTGETHTSSRSRWELFNVLLNLALAKFESQFAIRGGADTNAFGAVAARLQEAAGIFEFLIALKPMVPDFQEKARGAPVEADTQFLRTFSNLCRACATMFQWSGVEIREDTGHLSPMVQRQVVKKMNERAEGVSAAYCAMSAASCELGGVLGHIDHARPFLDYLRFITMVCEIKGYYYHTVAANTLLSLQRDNPNLGDSGESSRKMRFCSRKAYELVEAYSNTNSNGLPAQADQWFANVFGQELADIRDNTVALLGYLSFDDVGEVFSFDLPANDRLIVPSKEYTLPANDDWNRLMQG